MSNTTFTFTPASGRPTITTSISVLTSAAYGGASATTSLLSCVIGSSAISLDDSVFAGASSITSIDGRNNSTITIANTAFSGCTSLKICYLPLGITNIGDFCFNECNALTQLDLSPALTSP